LFTYQPLLSGSHDAWTIFQATSHHAPPSSFPPVQPAQYRPYQPGIGDAGLRSVTSSHRRGHRSRRSSTGGRPDQRDGRFEAGDDGFPSSDGATDVIPNSSDGCNGRGLIFNAVGSQPSRFSVRDARIRRHPAKNHLATNHRPLAPPATSSISIHQINFPPSPSPLPTFSTTPPRTSTSDYHAPPPPHIPRFHNLELSLFDGKEDPLGWLNRCEQYFRGQRTVEEDKVWLASYHLTGATQQWYHLLEREEPSLSWPRFKNLCHQRFGTPLRQNALGELARLSFRTTVEDYQDRFMALLCHVAPLAPEQQVQLFTAGLPDPIHIDVELLNPPDLNTALATAQAYEHRSQSLPWGHMPAGQRQPRFTPRLAATGTSVSE
jgi:hypothetical protein